ncbi:MAG: DUF1223 domain-containing protein [Dokdonella sp.]|uniref:DUF1223 domain-containing protein n=1 Tax=Dokdonella sp. TaxID=2291710 RepID=UPI0032659B3E
MRMTAIGVLLTLATASAAHADCSVSSGTKRAHLVELYTSEGCSSCPPADRWLGALRADPQLIPLAFHVDYWDSSSWSDRFADPRYAQRQRAMAAQSHSTTVYTPEVAVDGREWRNWSSGQVPASTTASPVQLTLHVQPGASLHARLDATPAVGTDAGAYVAWFALSEDQLTSAVRGGENRGEELHHDHVVRRFIGPLKLDSAQATIDVPTDLRRDHASVSAFVQRVDGGDVDNIVQLALQSCAAAPG